MAGTAALAACGPASEFHHSTGRTMGTEYAVTWSGGTDCTPALAHRLEAELHRVNLQMSTYLPDSELSRFNRGPVGKWMPVSAELAAMVVLALELSRRSDGAFDVTVGPLVNLWGFGAEERGGLPTAAEVEHSASRVDYRLLEVRASPPALRKRTADLYVDLSAIAKGHGVDRVAGLLENHGCGDYLVDIGGEVRVRGLNPHGERWRIGIQTPGSARGHPSHKESASGHPSQNESASGHPSHKEEDVEQVLVSASREWARQRLPSHKEEGVEQVLVLSAGAVATSGDYRNFRLVEGMRLSHTVDPRTGWPVKHPMASVTVVAESAALADGLATLINVLGPVDGLAFASDRQIAALALIRRQGMFEQRYTDPMRDYLENAP